MAPGVSDLINGYFELAGAVFVLFSIRKLWRDRQVRGVSWAMVAFFTAWGWWNLYFYPAMSCWFSFTGGAVLVLANSVYLGGLIYWSRPRA